VDTEPNKVLYTKYEKAKMKKTQKYMAILALVLPTVLGACGGSGSSATTTTVGVTTTTEKSRLNFNMICTPGACAEDGADEDYLKLVKNGLTPDFLSTISDADLFTLATGWCKYLSTPGGWPKIKADFQDKYDKGKKNEYMLLVGTILGSLEYCPSRFGEIRGFVESLPELNP
jgi:hypothetical protein